MRCTPDISSLGAPEKEIKRDWAKLDMNRERQRLRLRD
jgi:hypothetical protein